MGLLIVSFGYGILLFGLHADWTWYALSISTQSKVHMP